MATSTAVPVEDAVDAGIGLAFVAFPEIISQLPGPSGLYGVLFYGSLVLAGLSSLVSICQTYIAALQERFGMHRENAVVVAGGGTALVSIVYATGGGINTLDVVDRFINFFGIAAVGLVEVVFVAWLLRELPALRHHANATSDLLLGRWWLVSLGIVTPLVLGWMLVDNLRLSLAEPYGDYPRVFLLVFGWGMAAIVLALGILLSRRSWPEEVTLQRPPDPVPRRPEGPRP